MKDSQFLQTLKIQAQKTSVLEHSSPLPQFTHPFSALIGNYPWQTILLISFLLALLLLVLGFNFWIKNFPFF